MNIKKILAALLAVMAVGASMPAVSVNFPKISLTANAEETESSLTYEILDYGTIEITGCDKSVTTVEIPAEIDGKKVTSIGNNAFEYCSGLTSITIPDSVTGIGERAFEYCSSLTEITIPDSVTSIGGYAFRECSNLTSITIPESVTSIENTAFMDCSSLKSINVSENNKKFSEMAGVLFNKDKTELIAYPKGKNETKYIIPDTVTSIGTMAFVSCSGLTSITIPSSVKSIGASAFAECSHLTSITISDSVISIGGEAFAGTPWLEEKQKENPFVIVNGILIDGKTCSGDVTIPNSVTSIGDTAFMACSSLTSVTIPDSVTTIGILAFLGCESLTEITILDGVTSIGDSAFNYCTGLTEITIPNSVTSIGDHAFANCFKVTEITILNPNCKINNNFATINFDAVIKGYSGSTAQAYAEKYGYKFEALGKAPESKVIAGDANCDGKVSIADATAILQHLGNQDKYGLSAKGLQNADVDENDGVSTNDALVIQKVDANLLTVEQLPLKK